MRIPLPPCCLLLVVLEEAYTGSCVLLLLLLDESWRLTKGREGRDWRIRNGLFQVPQSLRRPALPCPALRGSSLETMPAQGMLFLSLCSPPCWRQARVLGTPPAHAAQPSIPPFLCLQNLRTEAWPSGQVLSVAPLLADRCSNPLGGRFSGRAVWSVGAKKIPLAMLAARFDPLGHGSGFGKFFRSRVASS